MTYEPKNKHGYETLKDWYDMLCLIAKEVDFPIKLNVEYYKNYYRNGCYPEYALNCERQLMENKGVIVK